MRTETVSLIGVGNMGSAAARRLRAVGYPAVMAYDTDPKKVATLIPAGVIPAASVEEAAAQSDVVIILVPGDPELKEVASRIVQVLPFGSVLLKLSTVSAGLSRDLAEECERAGRIYLGATVVGRPPKVEAGEVGVLVAGEPAAKQQVQPILESLSGGGGRIRYLGRRPGLAEMAKAIVNFHIAATILIQGETALLARACGIDPVDVFGLLGDDGCQAFGGATWNTYALTAVNGSPEEALFSVRLARKDLGLIQDLADGRGIRLPSAEQVTELLEVAIARGLDYEDWAVVQQVLATEYRVPAGQPV